MGFTAHQPMWVILCRKRLYDYYNKLQYLCLCFNQYRATE